jgi:hypothetical protein
MAHIGLARSSHPQMFDEWSNVIAAHYPAAVRKWYMQEARYQTHSALRLSGRELIRLGIAQCT